MPTLIFLLSLFLFFGSVSFAQVYKYVDKKGAICFTDNPPSSVFKGNVSNKENKDHKTKEVIGQRKSTGSDVKDIMQLGHQVLEEELAKPPEKQNRRLIQEMTEILYGDVSNSKKK